MVLAGGCDMLELARGGMWGWMGWMGWMWRGWRGREGGEEAHVCDAAAMIAETLTLTELGVEGSTSTMYWDTFLESAHFSFISGGSGVAGLVSAGRRFPPLSPNGLCDWVAKLRKGRSQHDLQLNCEDTKGEE